MTVRGTIVAIRPLKDALHKALCAGADTKVCIYPKADLWVVGMSSSIVSITRVIPKRIVEGRFCCLSRSMAEHMILHIDDTHGDAELVIEQSGVECAIGGPIVFLPGIKHDAHDWTHYASAPILESMKIGVLQVREVLKQASAEKAIGLDFENRKLYVAETQDPGVVAYVSVKRFIDRCPANEEISISRTSKSVCLQTDLWQYHLLSIGV